MSKFKWMILLLTIAFASTIFLVMGVRNSESLALDGALNHIVLSVFSEDSYSFFRVITELGDKIGIGIVVLMVTLWLGFKKRDFVGIIVLVLAVALGNEASKWLKEVIGRERPVTAQLAESLSFPSGHAMVGLILYFITSYLLINHLNSTKLKWGIGIISLLIVLSIGLSRIVLEDHYPTDVIGGYVIGLIWSILWILFYKILRVRIEARFLKKETPLNQ